MGIRFYCPNGHKLNVKAEQAGKIGFCPDCGVRVQIPLESTRPSSHKKNHGEYEGDETDPNPDTDIILTGKTEPSGLPIEENSPVPAVEKLTTIPPITPESAPAPENDEAVWFVRGSDNQNYGPITNAVIQDWISQRRVGPTMLVWREGWASWLEAKGVFPEIEKIFSTPQNVSGNIPPTPPAPPTPSPEEDEIAALKKATREDKAEEKINKTKLLKKKNKAVRDLTMVIGLVVVILVLLAILIVILVDQKKPASQKGGTQGSETSVASLVSSSETGLERVVREPA